MRRRRIVRPAAALVMPAPEPVAPEPSYDFAPLARLTDDPQANHWTCRFDTWGDFLDFLPKHVPLDANGREDGATAWNGNATWNTACALARDGWPEGATLAARYSLADFQAVASLIERPRYVYDYEGSDLDIARLLDGEPESFTRQEIDIVEGPGRRIVRIVASVGATADVDADSIMRRGAAIVALAQAIELAGHGSEITVASCVGHYGGSIFGEVYVRVKDADQPLDLPRVAFACAHASMLRRFMFGVRAAMPRAKQNGCQGVYASMGSSADGAERGDVYLGRMGAGGQEADWNNSASVKAWILKTLAAQGITLKSTEGA